MAVEKTRKPKARQTDIVVGAFMERIEMIRHYGIAIQDASVILQADRLDVLLDELKRSLVAKLTGNEDLTNGE